MIKFPKMETCERCDGYGMVSRIVVIYYSKTYGCSAQVTLPFSKQCKWCNGDGNYEITTQEEK